MSHPRAIVLMASPVEHLAEEVRVAPTIVDRRLAVYARRQHGLFTLEQALRAGLSRSSIRHRLDVAAWDEVEPRVYRALPAPKMSWRQALQALTLVTRGHAARRSAGALFDLLPEGLLEVVVRRTARCASTARAHSTDTLPDEDVTTVDGIPTTSEVRTILDLGGVLAPRQLADVVDAGLTRRLVEAPELARRATELAAPARPGCSR